MTPQGQDQAAKTADMIPIKSESSVKKFKVVVDQVPKKSIGLDEESLQNDNNQNNEEEYQQMLSGGI